MKNTMKKLLSALLALCMVAGTFTTVLFTSVVPAFADDTKEEDDKKEEEEGDGSPTAEELLNIAYISAEDKLKTMSIAVPVLDEKGNPVLDDKGQPAFTYKPWLVKGDLELYVQNKTGEVAIRNTKTGQVIFSNPYDAKASVESTSVLEPLFAQLNIKYQIIAEGATKEMDSYTQSAKNDQILVSYIKNGICVDYTIGRADDRRLVPMCMEKYRFETHIMSKIQDESARRKMDAYYSEIFMDDASMRDFYKQKYGKKYPILKKYDSPDHPFQSEGYPDAPGSYRGPVGIYILAEDQTTNYEKNKIEEYIRSWCPEYNYDALAYDHDLIGYVGKASTQPVFKMALEYRLDEDGFNVRLPANSISFNEDYFRLLSVEILPYMGAGSSEHTGYAFLPDGSGTLIRFEDFKKENVTFGTGTMYGPDNAYHKLPTEYTGKAEKMRYPVFGMVEDGFKTYTTDEKTETLKPKCKHRIVEVKLEADCVKKQDGCTIKYCAACGEIISDSHDTDNFTPYEKAHKLEGPKTDVVEATCEHEGSFKQKCSICKEIVTVTVPKLEHTYMDDYESEGSCKVVSKCTVCGHIKPLEEGETEQIVHEFGEWVEKRENGVCKKVRTCGRCGEVEEQALEHHFGEYSYREDEHGLCVSTRVCADCGFKEVVRAPHVPKDDGVQKHDHGHCYTEHICKHCGEKFTEERNHNVVNGVCTECGAKVEVDGHTLEEVYICENGVCYRVIRCIDEGCHHVQSKVAVAHEYSELKYLAATCTLPGRTAHVCRLCGQEILVTPVEGEEPTGHDFRPIDGHGNCKDGFHGYCVNCGEEKYIAPQEHQYVEKEECIIPETETRPGLYKETCKICGHVIYKEYPPLGNTPDEGGDGNENGDGEDPEVPEKKEDIQVPVSSGFLAVMTEGSSMASLSFTSDGGRHKYNYLYMTVNPRPQDTYNLRDALSSNADANWTVVSERKYTGSYSFKYFMLQSVDEEKAVEVGDIFKFADSKFEASYSGMAAAYRDYLVKNGILTPIDQKDGKDIPLYLEAFGSMEINSSFLTIPTVESKPLTSFEDLETIINELKVIKDEDGKDVYHITNVKVRLTGFTNGGMDPTMPYKVKFEKVLGGNEGFEQFLAFAKKNTVGVYPEFDFAYVHNTAMRDGYEDTDHAIKTIDNRFIVKKDYNATLQMFTPTGLLAVSASVYDYFYETFNKNYSKFGNMGISASTLGTDLNSDFDEDEPYNREDTREFTERLLQNMKKDYQSVMVDGGNAYVYPYVDHILNMATTGSEYLKTSNSVPFLGMVLHGNINYAGKPTNMASSLDVEILKILENGASPYFLIAAQNTKYLKEDNKLSKYYSLDYSTWKEDIISTYRAINDVLKNVKYATFDHHDFVTGVRIPDVGEYLEDYKKSSEAIIEVIEDYEDAIERYKKANALIDSKWAEVNKYKEELLKLSSEDKLTEEKAKELQAKLEAAKEIAEHKSIIENVKNSKRNLDEQEKKYLEVMAKYSHYYKEAPTKELTVVVSGETLTYKVGVADYYRYKVDANENPEDSHFRGAVFVENGKHIVSTDGIEGAKSEYEITNGSVVKVTYDNGFEIYLNYNDAAIIVVIDGENVVIDAYGYTTNA